MSIARILLIWCCPLAFFAATSEAATDTLRDAAAAAGVSIGVATSPKELATGVDTLVAREFNSVTPENQLKWGAVSAAPGVFDFTEADALVAFAEANDMRIRGHTLVWDRLNGPPDWLDAELAAALDPATRLRELMLEQIATVVGRYAGRLAQWDVVNEPIAPGNGQLDPDNRYFELLGDGFIAEAFRAAHDADPEAELFLNEVGLEASPARFAGLLDLLEQLLASAVPIDGVGLQGHFSAPPDGAMLAAQIGEIASLGLRVEVTELDLPLALFASQADPLAAQAAAYANVVAACLAVPACTGITTWGVTDADTWLDNAAFWSFFAPNRPLLFDEEGDPKPAYDAVLSALAAPEPGPTACASLAALAMVAVARARSSARIRESARLSSLPGAARAPSRR